MEPLRRSCQQCVKNIGHVRLQHNSAPMVNPLTSSTVINNEKRGCSISNTILYQGLPPVFDNTIGPVQNNFTNTLKEAMSNTKLEQSKSFDMTPNKASDVVKFKYNMTAEMLKNMMKSLWTNHASNTGLKDTTISSRQKLMVQWGKLDKKVSNKNEHLISGKKLLPSFASQEIIETSREEEVEWEDLVSLDLRDLPQSSQGDDSAFPCPQKLLSVNNFRWNVRLNQGLFYSFAQALTYALNHGAEIGQDLKDPVPVQAVTFNGTSFCFLWYQLNTLKLNGRESLDSVRNLAWTKEVNLCDKIIAKIPQTEYSVVYTGESIGKIRNSEAQYKDDLTIEGFNQQSAELFINFMLYPANQTD